ncbi:MAG TPA: hypothetical protein VIM96_00695 [Pseudomonadales bacterium]
MRNVIVLLMVLAAAWWVVMGPGSSNPDVIEDPVYLEHRVDFRVGSDIINMVLFVKAVDDEDCNERARRSWEKSLSGCENCILRTYECKDAIPGFYWKTFEHLPLDITYLSAERGNRYERSGRIVFWGLNQADSDRVCDFMTKNVKKTYSGTLTCIRPVSD